MSTAPYGIHLGARVERELTHFATYAPAATRCALRLFAADLTAVSTEAMAPSEDGLFALSKANAGHGTLYKFVLDGRELPDPYARFLPYGVHGLAMVVEPHHVWRHGHGPTRPLSAQVIYELHVGTFSEEGTYLGALKRLVELADLGVTTLELMPVSTFAGLRGWGYDGVAHFAPFAPYGTPDELRELVDAAHGLGLSVLLDVVYNHFGPAGSYLGAYSPTYFTRDVMNAWGEAPCFADPAMRAYVLDNVRYWLDEFRFDGLRLDAVHTLVDRSEKHVLREIVETARALSPSKWLIAEDDRNDPALVMDVGLNALWADDFHHQVRVTLTREQDGYYRAFAPGVQGIAQVIEQGFLYEGQQDPSSGKKRGKPARHLPASAFVYCIQNHDQVGNRALGDRLHSKVSIDAYCMVSTLLLFLPMTPLLFMGQEWAASTPFLYFTDHDAELGQLVSQGRREEFKNFAAFSDPAARTRIPDPQSASTFRSSKLRWDERSLAPHGRVLALFRELLSLRRHDQVLVHSGRDHLRADAQGQALVVRRWTANEERVLVANFGADTVALETLGLSPDAGVLFSTRGALSGGGIASEQALILALPLRIGET